MSYQNHQLTPTSDTSPTLTTARHVFLSKHPSTPPCTETDLLAIRQIASHVAYRASGVVAAGIHGLWQMRNIAEGIQADQSSHTLVAYNGSVMENYPDFRKSCQSQLDALVQTSGGEKGVVELMYAEESSLLGAAVAVACIDG
jgi:hexokinase